MGSLALQGFSLFFADAPSTVPTYADETASAKCNFLFDPLQRVKEDSLTR